MLSDQRVSPPAVAQARRRKRTVVMKQGQHRREQASWTASRAPGQPGSGMSQRHHGHAQPCGNPTSPAKGARRLLKQDCPFGAFSRARGRRHLQGRLQLSSRPHRPGHTPRRRRCASPAHGGAQVRPCPVRHCAVVSRSKSPHSPSAAAVSAHNRDCARSSHEQTLPAVRL